MKLSTPPTHSPRSLLKGLLIGGFSLLSPLAAFASFGLTTSTDFYTVDTDAGLVFKIRRTDNGVSTQSAGDIASLKYNGVEYQNQTRGSQVNSGFDYLYTNVSAVTVTADTIGTNLIKITVKGGDLTHYYIAKKGLSHIYMATYFSSEPSTLGLCRYIVRIPQTLLPNGPTPSDIHSTTLTVESSDVFGFADGTTRSKHYSNHRLLDWRYTGATGTNVGVWMVRSNHEGDSGGPFFRCLINQCGSDQEIYEIVNYGENQTESFRTNVLNGPYILVFTTGSTPPALIDTSWLKTSGLDLLGYVPDASRGRVVGAATGIPSGFQGVVGFANSQAEYWCVVSNGRFTSPAMIPGTYTQTLYKGELAVATQSVTVSAASTTSSSSATVTSDIVSAETTPSYVWKIGDWDGTPNEFLNADKVTTMHPSDTRISTWTPGDYVVGTSSPSSFPCYIWKDVNNSQVVRFTLTSDQVKAHTLRIGLTAAYSGARFQVQVNSYKSAIPSASTQPKTRSLTVGTYRGNNTTYTYAIPASAFVVGENVLTLIAVSGTAGTKFLSPGLSVDCVEMD